MSPIEVARKLAAFGQAKDACKAYELALMEEQEPGPDEKMEAALFVLQFGGDYRLAYMAFLELNHGGEYAEDTRNVMREAFYLPNEKLLRSHYEKNCKALKKYPYLFRDDFVPFEELPVKFYPFDDTAYVPYFENEDRFGEITDFNDPVITRNFFKDLEKPILAEDVYSQYELEYLCDNVRPSEFIGRENHIYLHYTSWEEFCAYLQVLNLKRLLDDKKIVFLIGNEIELYPIDFKEKFGIDYGQFPLKPLGVREIHRLIWHFQLSYHNGGDFINEVMDGHPNIISSSSYMNDEMEETLEDLRSTLDDARSIQEVMEVFSNGEWDNLEMIQELYFLRGRTDKDILVALFCCHKRFMNCLDLSSRIAPAIFYQPHFSIIRNDVKGDKKGRAIISSDQYNAVLRSSVFRNFKYVKTFAPMRRMTTSYGASIRFMYDQALKKNDEDGDKIGIVSNQVVERTLLRTYLVDESLRIFKDCRIVRFEDGKLNPKATFTALAAFLDIPYTDTLTYCSFYGEQMDEIGVGNVQGFDPASVYRTYDEYAGDEERYYLEYFLRDAYEYYGYDFKYYDGQPVDEIKIKALVENFHRLYHYMRITIKVFFENQVETEWKDSCKDEASKHDDNAMEQEVEKRLDEYMESERERALSVAQTLMDGLKFVNEKGQPLKMIPKLELDPALLEQPLYR